MEFIAFTHTLSVADMAFALDSLVQDEETAHAAIRTFDFDVKMLYSVNCIVGLLAPLALILAPLFLDKPLPYALGSLGRKILFIVTGYLIGLLSFLLPFDPGWYSVMVVAIGWPKIIYGISQTSFILGKAIELAKIQSQTPSHG